MPNHFFLSHIEEAGSVPQTTTEAHDTQSDFYALLQLGSHQAPVPQVGRGIKEFDNLHYINYRLGVVRIPPLYSVRLE